MKREAANSQHRKGNMKRIRTIGSALIAGTVGLLLANEAQAWSSGGHKLVALIAYEQLDEATRVKVVEILARHPLYKGDFQALMRQELHPMPTPHEIQRPPISKADERRWLFAQAAIWPDLAVGTPYARKDWHQIYTPIYLNAASEEALRDHLHVNLQVKWTEATPEMELNAPQVLDLAVQVVGDGKVTKSVLPDETLAQKKAILLCWLIHLVGDLHQPLHDVALFSQHVFPGGDHGGSDILLPTRKGMKEATDLHTVWDNLFGSDVSLDRATAIMKSILAQPALTAKAKAAAPYLSVETWLSEAQALAKEDAYVQKILDAVTKADASTSPPEKVAAIYTASELAAYKKSLGPIANERVAIAGYRLAAALKLVVK
jgi:hypothetical protein